MPATPVVALLSLLLLSSTWTPLLAEAGRQGVGLKIVVIAGEDGVNIIQQKTAVSPIVEVRDRNDLPIAGAIVVFTVAGGRATLNGGSAATSAASQVTLVTDATGRATVSVNPLSRGVVQIQARATYQGQSATATVRQMNFTTQAEAAQATQTATAAAGGLSAGLIAGIVGGAAGGTALAVKAAGGGGGGGSSNQTPVAGVVMATPPAVLAGTNTPVAFTIQGTDADNDPLTYSWDFGDGSSGSGPTPTHAYAAVGTYTVTVTVSDGKASATSQTTVSAKSVGGNWGPVPVLTFNQAGSSFTGSGNYPLSAPLGVQPGTISAGTLRSSSPRVTFTFTYIQNVGFGCSYTYTEVYNGDPLADGNGIQGNATRTIRPNSGACAGGVQTENYVFFLARQ